ncbi:hypothetical protein E2542_SST22160 [Spatholobus suberectus]|nr:hypothetical protein E2542_SST22160 [Spatholobus suberectus]
MELKNVVKDKKFWMASFLIAWAGALQGHMMWLQRQDSFKQKFGNPDDRQSQTEVSYESRPAKYYPDKMMVVSSFSKAVPDLNNQTQGIGVGG